MLEMRLGLRVRRGHRSLHLVVVVVGLALGLAARKPADPGVRVVLLLAFAVDHGGAARAFAGSRGGARAHSVGALQSEATRARTGACAAVDRRRAVVVKVARHFGHGVGDVVLSRKIGVAGGEDVAGHVLGGEILFLDELLLLQHELAARAGGGHRRLPVSHGMVAVRLLQRLLGGLRAVCAGLGRVGRAEGKGGVLVKTHCVSQ